MHQLITTLTNLKNANKQAEKTEILSAITDPTTKRLIQFLADDNQILGLSTKKLNKNVQPIAHDMNLIELIEYLLQNNTGSDYEIGLVQHYLSQFDEQTKDILAQIIAKTWKINVGASTLNKVYGPQFVIVFSVQLAEPHYKALSSMPYDKPYIVTQKLDGLRAIIEIKDDKVLSIKSRKGKPYTGLSQLKSAIESTLTSNQEHFIYDGELLLEDPTNQWTSNERFQETISTVKSNKESENVGFYLFDALPYEEFIQGQSTLTYAERRENYIAHIQENKLLHVVPILSTATKSEIPQWSDYAGEHGFEGVMLNDPDAKYYTKRHKGLLKVKKMHTADLPIIGFEEAIDGKNKGGLKSLIVRLDDQNVVNVASGLTDELHTQIWNNQDDYLGQMIEVQYFEETTNQNGGRSLRFPVFRCFRDDKTPDDINIE